MYIEMNEYEFCFTQTYTSKVRYYRIDPSCTITQFIIEIKSKAYEDFDVDRHDTLIHIVETGQDEAELAPEIQDSDIKVREKYPNNSTFYLRFIVESLPHLILVS
jgi:hypothetical protein